MSVYRRDLIGFQGTGWYTIGVEYRLMCPHPENPALCISVGCIDARDREKNPEHFTHMREWIETLYLNGIEAGEMAA